MMTRRGWPCRRYYRAVGYGPLWQTNLFQVRHTARAYARRIGIKRRLRIDGPLIWTGHCLKRLYSLALPIVHSGRRNRGKGGPVRRYAWAVYIGSWRSSLHASVFGARRRRRAVGKDWRNKTGGAACKDRRYGMFGAFWVVGLAGVKYLECAHSTGLISRKSRDVTIHILTTARVNYRAYMG